MGSAEGGLFRIYQLTFAINVICKKKSTIVRGISSTTLQPFRKCVFHSNPDISVIPVEVTLPSNGVDFALFRLKSFSRLLVVSTASGGLPLATVELFLRVDPLLQVAVAV